ncbi:MAG: FkbM family methyltransferase [Planctomycetes bacterium]|nr:FkbM family methyltransferase [Planctomycetota bacterium]
MDFKTKTVRVPSLGLDFDVLADDLIIGPSIEKGSWADHETLLFLKHVRPGDRVVDLGANVGWFAVQAIMAGADVHAFEPVPGIADVAERNMKRAMEAVAKRGGKGKGVLHRVAAGAEKGSAQIAIGKKNFGDNRVVAGAERPKDMGDGTNVTIQIAPVDDFVTGPVRFFKIDTQGFEWFALAGMKKVLASSPQCALLIEFWPYALQGCKPEQLLDLLYGLGFTIGKATEAPYPMTKERVLKQSLDPRRDPVKGGIDLYGVRGGLPFHVVSLKNRLRAFVRGMKET